MQLGKKLNKLEWIGLAVVLIGLSLWMLNWAVKSSIHYQKDVVVPDLTRQSLSTALDTLSSSNLGIRKEGTEFDETVAAGTILRQTPPPGSMVREGKIIRVVLSQGNEIIVMPPLVGQSLRSAEIMLRNNLLSVGEVKTRPSAQYEKDFVIEQSPAPKSVLKRGDKAHLIISEGPPTDGTILTPDFVGKNYKEAQDWAQEHNINLTRTDAPSAFFAKDLVSGQNVKPDAPINANDTIALTVSSQWTQLPSPKSFKYEAAQGQSGKNYSFVLVDGKKTHSLWSGTIEPGFKQEVALPAQISNSARVRIFVDGIMIEERKL